MLKKIIVSAVTAASLFVGSQFNTTEAYISQNQMALGGVPVPSRSSVVYNIYGDPTKNAENGFGTMMYGNSVEIGLEEGNICSVTVLTNNGWKTPAGIAVGMNISDVKSIYGNPDRINSQGEKIVYTYLTSPKEYYSDGVQYFDYILYIMCDQKGKIRLLQINSSRMTEYNNKWVNNGSQYLLDNYYWKN